MVWRKPNAKSRSDGQEPNKRCDVFGASGHVTIKPSICKRDTFYKLGVYAMKAKCLTPGGLHVVRRGTDGEVIQRERHAEVSRGHSSVGAGRANEALQAKAGANRYAEP